MFNTVSDTTNRARSFARDGFTHLAGFARPELIALLTAIADETVERPDPARSSYGNDFSGLTYSAHTRALSQALTGSRELASALGEITGKELAVTQGIVFEIAPGKRGFHWHFGLISFCFLHPCDFGCSLWIPLDPVDPAAQHGGMAYVSKDYLGGDFRPMARTIESAMRGDREQQLALREIERQYMTEGTIIPRHQVSLLEQHRVEQAFEVGDALLFDKWIYHRSCALQGGARASRRAFVIRFVDAQARYSRELLTGVHAMLAGTGSKAPEIFELEDLETGDRIASSERCVRLGGGAQASGAPPR
ncbi:MAG: hypothetical protein KC636_09775 [Myxococcales bacterium]|nr:hypothetical protein [Myxococcales bacterium]